MVAEILNQVFEQKARCGTHGRHYAAFDFDMTCIENDIGEAVLSFMARNNFPGGRASFEAYHSLKGTPTIQYRFGASTLKGMCVNAVEKLTLDTLVFEGTRIFTEELFGQEIRRGIALRTKVMELMRGLREDGVDIWIVTASPAIIVRTALRHLKIDAKLIGVRHLLRDGKITEHFIEPVPIFEGKAQAIKEIHGTARPLIGVGDSMNDLAMLEHSQFRAVVNRGNRLTARAREEGWFLL